jgi:hypothetical protein
LTNASQFLRCFSFSALSEATRHLSETAIACNHRRCDCGEHRQPHLPGRILPALPGCAGPLSFASGKSRGQGSNGRRSHVSPARLGIRSLPMGRRTLFPAFQSGTAEFSFLVHRHDAAQSRHLQLWFAESRGYGNSPPSMERILLSYSPTDQVDFVVFIGNPDHVSADSLINRICARFFARLNSPSALFAPPNSSSALVS